MPKHPCPVVVVIRANDRTSYVAIFKRLKTEQNLQDSVGANVNKIRRSASENLLLQLKKASGNTGEMCRTLNKTLGELATTSTHIRLIWINHFR
ncbi:hypothetical protein TKK_0008048 [Trichogramma kaykai]|uniref:Uncharacterized protein n=1 Tax=Trichogramma kaykai TaxID=54128 RepID=A0ABD2X5V9_9HYME